MSVPSRYINRMLDAGRRPLLLLLAGLTLFFAFFAGRIGIEQDTRSMISQDSIQVELNERMQQQFGNDEELLLSMTHPRLLESTGLALLQEVDSRLEALPGVARAFSLVRARQLVTGAYGAESIPLLPADADNDRQRRREIEAALQSHPFYDGLLISADRTTAGILLELKNRDNDPARRKELIGQVRSLMADLADKAEFHLTGVGVQQADVASYIERDQRVILPLVAAILALMLLLIFRRLSGLVLPMLATGVSLVWTMGFYALCGFELNTITSLLSPVVMVLAVSNSVHLYNGWLNLNGEQFRRRSLLAGKVNELFVPCFFTALTTAVGLLSLTISSIPAVRQFGLFAAIGVMFSFVVSMSLVPIGLSFLPLSERRYRSRRGFLRRFLQTTAHLTVNHSRLIMTVALLLLAITLFGIPRLQNNTNLVGFLHDDAPLAVDTAFIDRHLAGVNLLDFLIERKGGAPLNRVEDFARLERFEERVLDQPEIGGTFSVLTLLRPLHRAETGSGELALPDNDDDLRYELDLLGSDREQTLVDRFVSGDRKSLRFSVRLHDIGSRTAAAVAATLIAEGEEIFGSDYLLQPTGSFYRMTDDSNRLVSDMVRSFILSLTLVTLSILVMLRSPWLTLLSMIPNIIPILWTVGLMGYLDIDLSTGTAMIGAVVIGLAVDDTIHYLVHYRRSLNGSVPRAVTVTTTRVGRALMIASLVLAFGFWAGCFGSFKPTIYFSLLVGGTLIGALVCDLLVLPACLVLGGMPGKARAA